MSIASTRYWNFAVWMNGRCASTVQNFTAGFRFGRQNPPRYGAQILKCCGKEAIHSDCAKDKLNFTTESTNMITETVTSLSLLAKNSHPMSECKCLAICDASMNSIQIAYFSKFQSPHILRVRIMGTIASHHA